MYVMIEATSIDGSGNLSVGSIVLIVLPATIALLGIIVSTIVSSVTAHRSEDRRARNAVSAQVLEAGRLAEPDALYVVAEFVSGIKDFNRAMSGNSGEGEDDERSAAAFSRFADAFNGFDSLTKASMTVQALGAKEVAEKITTVRTETRDYVMSLEGPTFKGAHANSFESRVDGLMRDLTLTVRADFGTDAARVSRP